MTEDDPSSKSEEPRRPVLSEAAESFMRLLEERMLEGKTDVSNRHWAIYEMGVPEDTFEKLKALILRSWKIDSSTYAKTVELRDITGAQYLHVYNLALEKGNLSAALKALDSFSRLHGLDQPSLAPVTLGGGGITNSVRENVLRLLDRMQTLSDGARIVNASNGSNGHHKKLPMGADPDDNEGD